MLKTSFYVLQLIADVDVLRTVLLAFTAFDAQARIAADLSQRCTHEVLTQRIDISIRVASII